ncbi:MAG: hypothetical protein N0C86_20220 [Candidatus Thiodiazotropha taylori]|nr:hypothetical protein [Candidatus Thiodiazotropha taylori]MCW4328326.1 hypothetical protein [Candidatus Thiodiazotropha taylori]RLW55263.1 MAG: hypothetical protein B6D76_04150 [gamma proteobacterium symbiont of Stewartia floridana]RLW57756.1 MAG: hypothetical protein B6D75_15810 [gamma proteobacterium symbiont of Stewartia floridana]
MMQKIVLSVFIALGAVVCFYYSIIGFIEMVNGPSEIVSSVRKAGASSFQIWQMLSLLAFIVGLGLVVFLKHYWKTR